jgi:hypothetical protein
MKPGEEFLQWPETVHQTRYCRFVWYSRVGECIPKLFLASLVWTGCQVVFDNEHSLHLWKRHSCTSTVSRQLTDWRGQVTTWRDLRRLFYSESDIVCFLIQTNFIELQPTINILIWVAWLFDYPVLGEEILYFSLARHGRVVRTPTSYSRGPGFSRPGDRLSWLRFLVVFLSPSRQFPG